MLLVLTFSLLACASKDDKGPCKGKSCKTADLLDNTAPKQEWYCYGKSQGGEWQCGKQADETMISAIGPEKNERAYSEALLSEASAPITPTPDIQKSTVRKKVPAPTHIVNEKLVSETLPTQQTLATLPASYYAVQIIASTTYEGVTVFAKKVGIQEPIIAHITSRGSDWFILLLDVYPGYSEAKMALDLWIENHPKLTEPWIRKLGPLQESLVKREP